MCRQGWSGLLCEIDINECASNPCLNGATCVDDDNRFTCTCASGWRGATCSENINECASSPCINGGACTDLVNRFSCACAAGFNGTTCQVNIDDCVASPCRDGSSCIDGINSFTCQCNTGFAYVDSHCVDVDECASGRNNCNSQAMCTNTVGSFKCTCLGLYYGDGVTCTKVDNTAVSSTMCSELFLNKPASSVLTLAAWQQQVLQGVDVGMLLRESLDLVNSTTSNITFHVVETDSGLRIDFCIKINVEDFENVKDNLGGNFTRSVTANMVSVIID